jgi:hypothetical protein
VNCKGRRRFTSVSFNSVYYPSSNFKLMRRSSILYAADVLAYAHYSAEDLLQLGSRAIFIKIARIRRHAIPFPFS